MSLTALVPAFDPTVRLVDLVRELRASEFAAIVVVNDGSAPACDAIFAQVASMQSTTVLAHGVNRGKGAALKTGLSHIYRTFGDHLGAVTLDADGQHLIADVLRVVGAMRAHPDSLVLGSRGFERDVPLRSRFGNGLTRFLFRRLVGTGLTDTQTGLRGIPRSFIPALLRLRGDGYEFELEMLLAAVGSGRRIVEQPIATVYLDRNSASHFAPIRDSLRIYRVLLRARRFAVPPEDPA
jgi:glycosyltransferase involved in cell wall biosynthesis